MDILSQEEKNMSLCFYKATKHKDITGGQVFICLCHSGVFEDGIKLYFIAKYAVEKKHNKT